MAENERRTPVTVVCSKGRPPIPDPVPADYRQEIPEEALTEIEKKCDQKTLSGGKKISKFEW